MRLLWSSVKGRRSTPDTHGCIRIFHTCRQIRSHPRNEIVVRPPPVWRLVFESFTSVLIQPRQTLRQRIDELRSFRDPDLTWTPKSVTNAGSRGHASEIASNVVLKNVRPFSATVFACSDAQIHIKTHRSLTMSLLWSSVKGLARGNHQYTQHDHKVRSNVPTPPHQQ